MKNKHFEDMNVDEVQEAVSKVLEQAYEQIMELFENDDNLDYLNISIAINEHRGSINVGGEISDSIYRLYV